MQEINFQFHQKNIQYFKLGTGKPIVFLHGFGEDAAIWMPHAQLLSNQYLLIVPNIPGTGKSDLTPSISLYEIADCIKAILDYEHIQKITLIGHSMGGYVTLHFAEKYPQILNGMGLYHSSAFADTNEKKENRKKGIDFIKKNGSAKFLESIAENLFSTFTKEKRKKIITDYIINIPLFSNEAVIAYYNAMINRTEKTSVLNNSSIPTLFIVGKEDKAVPVSDTMQQLHLPNTSFITILDKVGHMGMLESFSTCHHSLTEFIQYCNP